MLFFLHLMKNATHQDSFCFCLSYAKVKTEAAFRAVGPWWEENSFGLSCANVKTEEVVRAVGPWWEVTLQIADCSKQAPPNICTGSPGGKGVQICSGRSYCRIDGPEN